MYIITLFHLVRGFRGTVTGDRKPIYKSTFRTFLVHKDLGQAGTRYY
jgi:hypothetical protein